MRFSSPFLRGFLYGLVGYWGRAFAQTSTSASAESTSCTQLTATYPTPSVAAGWNARLMVNGLSKPRGIIFDEVGNLLVVDSGVGVVGLRGGECGEVVSVVNSTELNHGIALSQDGGTLYASSSEAVYSWVYNSTSMQVTSTNQTVVAGMSNDDHTTRTLLISQKEPGFLVVSRGSNSNIDLEAESLPSGHSQIKAFTISNLTTTSSPYDFSTEGRLLGWGLRNSVGVAEEPLTGGIYSVENSADQITRSDTDIHEDNPGEEMNFHGFLNDSTTNQGGNYGYPYCFAAWDTNIPDNGDLVVGDQFSMDQNSTVNDTLCAERVAPRLTFQAHMAPLDIKFVANGTEAFVSFHGSWDRTDPVGYKVSVLTFANGEPTAESTSTSALTDIFANQDNLKCPDSCFRPVGLAWDSSERLWVSSDATGELYMLSRSPSTTGGGSTSTVSGTASPSASKTGTAVRLGCKWLLGGMGLVLGVTMVL